MMRPSTLLVSMAAALLTQNASGASTTTTSSSSSSTALSNEPSEEPVIGQITNQGCFNSSTGLTQLDENLEFNTDGSCGEACQDADYYVGATHASQECWCGNEYPPADSLVDDDECNLPCTGYDQTACGGMDTWSVYNLGVKLAVHNADDSSASSSSGTGSTASQTSSASTSESSSAGSSDTADESSDNSKTIGIAVGVVSAVIIVGGAVGGVFWYVRKKRNQEIEEEHRRNAAVNAFINGSNPPPQSSHGSISMTDSRLDPVMAHRRLSDGSIADNEDYSRKILRVTNA